jgi:hypothetical protein
MSIMRSGEQAQLTGMDEASHAACRAMFGYEMCRCGARGERPCAAIERVVALIAAEVRKIDAASKPRRRGKRR